MLTSQSGLALVGALLAKTDYSAELNRLPMPSHRGHNLHNSDIALSMIGLLCQGKCDFVKIESHRKDSYFPLALGIDKVPSASRLRQRLDGADAQWDEAAIKASMTLLKKHAIQSPCHGNHIAIDVDVSVMDNSGTKKEGVSKTYKHVDGYAPIFAHLGSEGYLLNSELREGKTHSQNGTASFLEQTFSFLPELPHKSYLLRMDGGFDSAENLKQCLCFNQAHENHIRIDYIIKRNLRKESKEHWLKLAEQHGSMTIPRSGKHVYIGKIFRKVEGFEQPLQIVFCVTERTINAKGQHLLMPEIEVETYWNSLEASAEKVIELYHDHGTSEQFHSELKTDIGLERLPSGYFQTNTRIMYLALLTFNLLRIMGQESLNYQGAPIANRHRIRRRRLRSVIQDLIYLAARLITHARGWSLGFGKHCPFYLTFSYLYLKWSG
jgi:hypothetical protein